MKQLNPYASELITMNKIIKISVYTLMITAIFSNNAYAANITDRVNGGGFNEQNIIPNSSDTQCVMSAGSSEINYGSQSRGQLQEVIGYHNTYTPGRRNLALSIVCPTARKMFLTLRGASLPGGMLHYGTQGFLHIRLLNATVDGRSVTLATVSPDGKQDGPSADSIILKYGQKVLVMKNGESVSGNTLMANLEITPILTESATKVSNRTQIESRFAIELLY
ncbi:hypothetical protein [Serratia quinivorans]|uniref:hypothetical protein n=1 Tax=Serratia quinivorans TaxID=137545 RepID=UPI0034C61B44